MTSWILTFAVITMINGNPVVREHVSMDMSGPEQCLSVLRSVRQSLPRTARIVQPRCQEVWRT